MLPTQQPGLEKKLRGEWETPLVGLSAGLAVCFDKSVPIGLWVFSELNAQLGSRRAVGAGARGFRQKFGDLLVYFNSWRYLSLTWGFGVLCSW